MIRYLKHDEIDKNRWDTAIDQSVNGMVYGKSWYLDITSPGWEALIKDDYKEVSPLTYRKKFGIHYLYQPFFVQQLGVFSQNKNAFADEFLNSIPEKFRLIDIQLNHRNQIHSSEYKISKRLTHHLDLNQPYEKLKSGYSENLRRNLKKAIQNNIQLINDFDTKELISLFRSNRGKEVKTLKDSDYLTFERLILSASEKGLISKVGAIVDNKLDAGIIFIRSNHEYIFLFSGAGEKAKESGAMSLIIDTFIQKHSGENMKLDFEGSMDSGLARFYKSFGSEEVVYLRIQKNRLPLPFRWLK